MIYEEIYACYANGFVQQTRKAKSSEDGEDVGAIFWRIFFGLSTLKVGKKRVLLIRKYNEISTHK